MHLRLLPVAPPPRGGEALSSWARRIAARYDLSLTRLATALLERPVEAVDDVLAAEIDLGLHPGVEAMLAEVTERSAAEVAALRPVVHVADAAWIRVAPAWCGRCLAGDLARDGEVHHRAAWRTAATAVFAEHRAVLQVGCDACGSPLSPPGPPRVVGGRVAGTCPWEPLRCAGRIRRTPPAPGSTADIEGLPLVLALQDALVAALAGRVTPPMPPATLVPGHHLPAVCRVLLTLLPGDAGRGGSIGTNPPTTGLRDLTLLVSVLDVLAGGRGVRMAASTPRGRAHLVPDLRYLLLGAGISGWHRLAREAPEIGGGFATAVVAAVGEVRRVPARQRVSLATGLGCVPRTT